MRLLRETQNIFKEISYTKPIESIARVDWHINIICSNTEPHSFGFFGSWSMSWMNPQAFRKQTHISETFSPRSGPSFWSPVRPVGDTPPRSSAARGWVISPGPNIFGSKSSSASKKEVRALIISAEDRKCFEFLNFMGKRSIRKYGTYPRPGSLWPLTPDPSYR